MITHSKTKTMALTAIIQPVQIIDKQAVFISAHTLPYGLDGEPFDLYWWISDSSGSKLYDGNWTVPKSTLEIWGSDDCVIIEALAQDKNFTIIGYPTGSAE